MPTHADRPARRSGVLTRCACLALAAAVLACAPPAPAAISRAAQPLPPQGLYEGCAPGTEGEACIEHLARIRAAGFRYVLDYSAWYGSPADVLRYADAAAALGLKLIWPLNNPAWRGLGSLAATYPTLAEGLGAATPPPPSDIPNSEFLARAVDLLAGSPATWGFYVGDELPAAEAGRVRRLSATVRRLAPSRPQLYIARPGIGRLAPFARFASVAGADTYPVGSGDPTVRRAAQSARVAALTAGARTAMVLQAFSWSQYAQGAPTPDYPTTHTLRAMRDAAIRHAHPAMILWYSYQDILRSDHPARRWHDLVRAAFGPISPVQPPR